jgi:hypothetical protein
VVYDFDWSDEKRRNKNMKQKIYSLATLIIIGTILLSGCTGITGSKIKEMNDNPGKFDGSEVTVSGKVIEADSVFGMGYKINDGESSILIVLGNSKKTVPKVGDQVTVTGIVKYNQGVGIAIDASNSK